MGETRKYLPQTILQAQTEDDTARCHFDGDYLFHLSTVLHSRVARRNRAQGIGQRCTGAVGSAKGLEANFKVCAAFVFVALRSSSANEIINEGNFHCVLVSFRGIRLRDFDLYNPLVKNTFFCLKSGKAIPFIRLNDNYCDCEEDGSDETETNACINGVFYCTFQMR